MPTCPATLDTPVLLDSVLAGLPGVYKVYAAYRVNGVVVHNAPVVPILVVGNSLVYDPATHTQTPGNTYFDGWEYVGNSLPGNGTRLSRSQVVDAMVGVYPDPAHVGQAVDMLMVSKLVHNERGHFKISFSQNWINWHPEADPLVAAQSLTLSSDRLLLSFHGQLPIAGLYQGFVGYRLPDGKIVYNGLNPLEAEVIE